MATTCLWSAGSKLHLIHACRFVSKGRHLTKSFSLTRGLSTVNTQYLSRQQSTVFSGDILTRFSSLQGKKSRGSHRDYFGVNGINASTPANTSIPSRNADKINIPPLDLLSVLEEVPCKGEETKQKVNDVTETSTLPKSATVDIPSLNLFDTLPSVQKELQMNIISKGSYTTSTTVDVNRKPKEKVGKSKQVSDNRANAISQEIAAIKRKLERRSVPKVHLTRLKRKLKKKRSELDSLHANRLDLSDIEACTTGLGLTKKQKRSARRAKSRQHVRERKRTEEEEEILSLPLREAKKYALPRPKASSMGILIPQFDSNIIQTQANGTILASLGTTSILSTVIVVPSEAPATDTNNSFQQAVLHSIQTRNAQNGSLFLPLEVEYRERWHASGKIPTNNQRRRDNSGPLSEREVLTSRAIDRTLRPWLMKALSESAIPEEELSGLVPEKIVVNCQVQSYDTRSSIFGRHRTHADPTVLAVNSAIAAIYQSTYSSNLTKLNAPMDAAACTKLAMMSDGTIVYDPTPDEIEESAFELLYAGTRDRVLMFEFSAKGDNHSSNNKNDKSNIDPGISEDLVADALRLGQKAILPIIEHQESMCLKYSQSQDLIINDETMMSDEDLTQMLGFSRAIENNLLQNKEESISSTVSRNQIEEMLDEMYSFTWSKLEKAVLISFGYGHDSDVYSTSQAFIYGGKLPSKKLRGRRETLIQNEVERLLIDEFVPKNNDIDIVYREALSDKSSSTLINALKTHVHEKIMQKGFGIAATNGTRADGRNLNAVRPISVTVPLFPDSVHGSSLFSRGETQVLSTATISAPKDGLPIMNPLSKSSWNEAEFNCSKDDENVPIGSLRFLRSQVELESDMNSRRVKAGREMTGDSGVLNEVKRSFLHYDFPDFSTGTIKSKTGGATNRRAIGHGNLAERAILPVLPSPDDFPYAIRLTCEVTSSNGSSSMGSVCGATLSMLDAGVPIITPVAGVSVGLSCDSQQLLLDITGTEDHFGNMDCKVCGTTGGITAIQCDVKTPVELDVIIGALDLAKHGRDAILTEMDKLCKDTLGGLMPRSTMKTTAPRVEIISYDPVRKRDLIGPGGSVLRQLEDRFNVTLDLSQDGRCLIFGTVDSVTDAKNVILDLVGDVEVGEIYEGTVIEIKDYGAVIELLRNKEGLLHVSEITDIEGKHPGGNLGLVNEHLKIGDKVSVLCTKIDHVHGSIKLSMKQLKNRKYLSESLNHEP